MNATDTAAFWDRLTDINAGLLRTDNGAARLVPMSHQLLDNDRSRFGSLPNKVPQQAEASLSSAIPKDQKKEITQ